MNVIQLLNILKKNFGDVFLGNFFINNNGVTIVLKKEFVNQFFFFLQNSNFFSVKTLFDIFGIDFLGRSNNFRFLLCYILYSRKFGLTFSIKVPLQFYDLLLTTTDIYSSANWLEREVYDMFGIYFMKNNDMRRILTDYGFEGFPLRKDFPLTGFFELQYSEEEKVVISNPSKVNQAFRVFHFSNVWGLAKNVNKYYI